MSNFNSLSIGQTFVNRVFGWMFFALLVSTLAAILGSSQQIMSHLVTQTNPGEKLTMLGWAVMLAPLVLGLMFIFGFESMSVTSAKSLFMIYSLVNGFSFSFIIQHYTTTSLVTCFVSAAAMFGVMAVYGYVTKKDLSSLGSLLFMGLIGLLIVNLILLFTGSSEMMDYIIGSIGVLIFCGLTAYDMQQIKSMSHDDKSAVMGAFQLYLDFVNIFLYLLRAFGESDD
jgi:FtsH-binding integral membrane protein